MRYIKLKLYSILKEIFNNNEITVEFKNDKITVEDILEYLNKNIKSPQFNQLFNSLRFIANNKILEKKDIIPKEVDVIHVLPPSSGGVIDVKVLTNEHVDLNDLIKNLYIDGNVGGVAIFIGVVRKVNKNEIVQKLQYEHSEELITNKLKEIAMKYINKYNLFSVVIYHYVGERKPGDLTMIVAVSGESRKNVFPALEEMVDDVKHNAPIWKQEYRESGRYFILGEDQVRAEDLKRISFSNK
ncbi:molybdopterin converting factor, large subunit [Caldisphaera lagunensis DSM 15908]|uniref:Molybdopterin converting factor, large subunit n=1 Tax=Caldisphaera lagunensis (strain DSM 15908 / JCM 11604 / ANMR 0165 / IC-154) TaxID=1056495 RepID=L0A8K6_CALLD|nr:molybdenum cofactor biosynthesis protein MoaE [Caldisphaera lagunensis]AFZ70161.1 molybdopterin converting factor, large subunit [Caldisphaera lagunensis DSM 15908]